MVNELLLLSGNDIPIDNNHLLMHPPTIKEIAFIGENTFFAGCEFIKFSKENLKLEDRSHLENISNFNILMSIMREKNLTALRNTQCMIQVLNLLFPTYEIQINFEKMSIDFKQDNNIFSLNEKNYDNFVNVLNDMLCLGGGDTDYKPSGTLARQIADKLKDRHAKLMSQSKDNQEITILSRYVSVLAVGENKDMNSLLNYTVYQLFDEYKRFSLKTAWDIHLKAQLAGATNLEDVDDWTKDIHSNVDDE